MITAVSKRLSDIEELERIEIKETARSIQADSSDLGKQQMHSLSTIVEPLNSSNE